MSNASALPYLVQQALNALPLAALYALLAFGYSLSFALSRRADFTPGALFAFAGQIFVFFTAFGWNRLWLVYPAALVVGAGAALGYTLVAARLIGTHVRRPLTLISPNALVAASLAAMIVLMELVRIAADSRDLWLSPFLNGHVVFWEAPGYQVVLTMLQIGNAATMALIVVLGTIFLRRSAFGRNWCACADDPLAAALMGVDPGRVTAISALVTALASAIAGIFATAYYGSMDFGAGLMFGLKVVMIAAIGDQMAPGRAALGAAAYGAVETFWGAYLPYALRDIALFSGLVLMAAALRRQERI
jgi:branched-chain amino acid transport system permease protein